MIKENWIEIATCLKHFKMQLVSFLFILTQLQQPSTKVVSYRAALLLADWLQASLSGSPANSSLVIGLDDGGNLAAVRP